MNYGGNFRNTLENLMFMSRAEDQDILNELVANKDNRILDWMYFEPGGGAHSISKTDPKMLVLVGEEYRPPFYGHVFYLGLKENLISPFTTGYEGTGIESLYPSNTDMFRKAKAQGAVTGYVHPHSGDSDPLERPSRRGQRLPGRSRTRRHRCLRVVEHQPRATRGVASRAQQRPAGYAYRRRGFDQQSSHLQGGRQLAYLRVYGPAVHGGGMAQRAALGADVLHRRAAAGLRDRRKEARRAKSGCLRPAAG